MTTRIFISYAQEDFKPEARYICNYLSKYVSGSDVFIDQLLRRGVKWKSEIEKKLLEADVFVVILTNAALHSLEVKKEVQLALSDSNKIIIPCKDDLLSLDWGSVPWNLNNSLGLEFERKEELARKLVGEIRTQTSVIKRPTSQSNLTKPIRITSIQNRIFELEYNIDGGEILTAELDRDACSLLLGITTFGNGTLSLVLPRILIDTKIGEEDTDFFVLLDGAEVDFQETLTTEARTITITFENGNTEIEIVGTQILGMSSLGIVKSQNIVHVLQNSHSMHGGKYLEPELLVVKLGDKVQWMNDDSASHTVTSGTQKNGPDGVFDSSLLMPNSAYETTFSHVGTYDYFCLLHPWKKGKIMVQ